MPTKKYWMHTNTRAYDSLIVVWVDTNIVLFQLKRILTKFAVLQFILVQVRPAPDASIDNMWKSLATSNLVKTQK